MKITNNQDIYNSVDKIIKQLIEANESDLAISLSNALTISGMPGEILGSLRCELIKLKKTQAIKQIGKKEEVSELIKCIDIAFRNSMRFYV